MKNKKLLAGLKNISSLLNVDEKEIALKNLNKLIEQVNIEILTEDYKSISRTTRTKACLKYADKLKKGSKPVLGYSIEYKDHRQIFTNGYFLVLLTTNDKLPLDAPLAEMNYPIIDGVIKCSIEGSYHNRSEFEAISAEILKSCKLNEYVEINGKKFSSEFVKLMFQFLNIDNIKKPIKMVIVNNRDLLIRKANGSDGLLMGIKEY